jgi:hypothetical protein
MVKEDLCTSTTVRLTPLTAILHLGRSKGFRLLSKAIVSISDQSLPDVLAVKVPVVSICHVTKCPSRRSPACIHNSILKRSQGFLVQKLVLSKDSCIAKKL